MRMTGAVGPKPEIPVWITVPSPTATSFAAAPQAWPTANMSMPWSNVQLPGLLDARGLRNGKRNPLRAVAGFGRTFTVLTTSGDGARPVAPGNWMPTWKVFVNRPDVTATPAALVVTHWVRVQAARALGRNFTATRLLARPWRPSCS